MLHLIYRTDPELRQHLLLLRLGAQVAKVKKRGRVRKPAVKRAGGRKHAPSGATKKTATAFDVRELDPISKCGAGTSVRRLFRIDEHAEDGVRVHLVFFDRHGWYCEHGRDCPAVAQVRTTGVGARPLGPNNNGRMRA
jgi:hypothetical protein